MKKKILLLVGCITLQTMTFAQAPKWVEKARKAVFSVVAYDENNQIKATGNGFYIDNKGTGLSDYTLFDNVKRAVVVNANGKELPVERISGANSIYDVVKFRTASDGKIEPLTIASSPAKVGETVYLLPYSTQKNATAQAGKVTAVDSIGNDGFYYTLSIQTTAKTVSCPIMNANGEVLGMIQKNASDEATESYAIGASYGASLQISALSANDVTLNKIKIQKALPEKEDQALVYLYMLSSNKDAYPQALEDFLIEHPNNYEGYLRRAALNMEANTTDTWKLAQDDIDKALEVASIKSEAKYSLAKMLYAYLIGTEEDKRNPDWTFEKTLSVIQEAVAEDPQPGYYQIQGDIQYALQQYSDAYESYSQINKTELATAATFFSAAKAKQMIEGTDIKDAIALMDSAVAKCVVPYTSEAAPYLYERALAKMEAKDYRGAALDFNDTYKAFNGTVNANFYYQREQAEVNCRMYKQALEDINQAVEMEPNDAVFWMEKGSVHIRVGQLDEAEAPLQKAIELDASLAPAYRMMGYVLAQKKKTKEAFTYFEKAKELGDTAVDALMEKYRK